MNMKPIIIWKRHTMDGTYVMGYVKFTRVFDIEPEGGVYALHCFLGAAKQLRGYFPCVEDAKKIAQQVFESFLSSIEYE